MIVVLCSLYNSQSWIKDLSDQFNKQTLSPDVIVVRNDSVKDIETIQLLKNLLNDIKVIDISNGKKLGAKGSFFKLLSYANKSFSANDMFMFSDHDDIWSPEKIAIAHASYINNSSSKRSWVHTHNYQPFESSSGKDQKSIKEVDAAYSGKFSLSSLMLWNPFLGCTLSFNHAAIDVALKFGEDSATMHDRAILLATLLDEGVVIIEPARLLRYRQHDNNAVGLKRGFSGLIARAKSYSSGYFYQNKYQISRCKEIIDTQRVTDSLYGEVNHVFQTVNGGLKSVPSMLNLPFRKKHHSLITTFLLVVGYRG